MALEGIGFAVGVIPEVRHQVTMIQERYSKFVGGPAVCRDLTNKLDDMISDRATIERIIQEQPGIIPDLTSPMFCRKVKNVKEPLERSKVVLGELSEDAFPASNSTRLKKAKAMARRAFHADSIVKKMESVASQVMEASRVLEGLVSELTPCIKMEDMNMNRADDHKEASYRPEGSTPMLAPTVSLDYFSKDAEGAFETPEGNLKHCVLISDSPRAVTAAVGVVGMAGVGKTIALQGLAHDKEIQARFPDGIHYMSLGHSATSQDVICQIGKIMSITGATAIVDKVEKSSSLRDAVDYAITWFRGKTCLFLIDDLWPTQNRETGYLNDLAQLLGGSPRSRMAITTRSVDIAFRAGLEVNFGARNPCGHVSLRLFMKYAAASMPGDHSSGLMRGSVSQILSTCGGLPIALSVTGCAVKFLFDDVGNFDNACDIYAAELQRTRTGLGDKEGPSGTSLNAGILLSLKYLDAEFLKWESANATETKHTVTDLYTGLCVLQNQAWVPLSVLCRLWNVDVDCAFHLLNRICAMSLATRHYRKHNSGSSDEPGLVLHDLHLEFCRRRAQRTRVQCKWHAQLLNGYIPSSSCATGTSMSTERIGVEKEQLLKFTPREWWSVPQDGYIHSNLSRHLSCAGHELELAALLIDARWTQLRGSVGGILALETDFEHVKNFLKLLEGPEENNTISGLEQSFATIFKAVRHSWGRYTEGLRAFQFQVCGRLVCVRQSNDIVESYLKSVESNTPKPYLVPVSSLTPDVTTAQITEIPVRACCDCVACSPCGLYVAAGAGRDIIVADCNTGAILKRGQGHRLLVTCIEFLGGSNKIVSGSLDGMVMVWTWETSITPTQVFEGCSSAITGLAVSADGQRIISTSQDQSVRAWDATAGTLTWELVQKSIVLCVALCTEEENIALGLGEGTLNVLHGGTNETLFEDTKADEGDILCVSFGPNGSHLATGSSESSVRVLNTQTWTWKSCGGHRASVTSISFSLDCKQFASSSNDQTIRLWNVGSGKCTGVFPGGSPIHSISFTPDSEKIASGSAERVIHIWDASLGNESKEERNKHSGAVNDVSISEDGLRVASASEDGTVRLWDSDAGDQVSVPLEGHYRAVECVSFSSDGRRVVTGSRDMTVRLWDTETHTQIGKPFEGHTNFVWCVSFSSDGLRIISGSYDESVRIWNAETHEQIGDVLQGHEAPVTSVSEIADGTIVVSRDNTGKTIIWNRSTRAMIWASIDDEGEMNNSEAEKFIRSCGRQTPYLWPRSFQEYTAELFCSDYSVYLNMLGERTLIANKAYGNCWVYHKEREIVVVELSSVPSAICKLITR